MNETLYDWFFSKYGVDWIATICTIMSAWRLGSKKADGWIWAMAAAASWIAFNLIVKSAPAALANVFFLAFNARGLWLWLREHKLAAASAVQSTSAKPKEPSETSQSSE
jgi:hypothetical protein